MDGLPGFLDSIVADLQRPRPVAGDRDKMRCDDCERDDVAGCCRNPDCPLQGQE